MSSISLQMENASFSEELELQMKTCLGFPTRSDTNWAVKPKKMTTIYYRGLKFQV